jgi:hypothetical protein
MRLFGYAPFFKVGSGLHICLLIFVSSLRFNFNLVELEDSGDIF